MTDHSSELRDHYPKLQVWERSAIRLSDHQENGRKMQDKFLKKWQKGVTKMSWKLKMALALIPC